MTQKYVIGDKEWQAACSLMIQAPALLAERDRLREINRELLYQLYACRQWIIEVFKEHHARKLILPDLDDIISKAEKAGAAHYIEKVEDPERSRREKE